MKAGSGILFFIPKSIKGQMVIMLSILVCFQIAVTAVIFNGMVGRYLEESHQSKTIGLAKLIAKTPIVIESLKSGETNIKLQQTIAEMERDAGAKFIVVAKRDGTRLAHPVPERIGEKFVGGDQVRAVENGEIYTSRAVGTLGPSLRGFAPVRDEDGAVIGFVSVGYLETSVLKLVHDAQKEPVAYLFIMLFVGLIGANLIGGYIKKMTLGLEPTEIASMHKEREVILNSVRSGIVAVDRGGRIRYANKKASALLDKDTDLKGGDIDELIPHAYITQRIENREEVSDEEVFTNGHIMLFNIIPVSIDEKRVEGAVATFRRKDEMDYLNHQLSQARQCSELLRVQSHEYSNKLHTISGLLQLEEYDEAKNIILKESEGYHRLVEYTDKRINCPMVAGVLLGKYNRAGELKCSFEVDYEGGWYSKPPMPEHIITIIANLIDNAIDAAKDNKSSMPYVFIGLYEDAESFTISVHDSGNGLPAGLDVFQKGVSTKADSRGIGLYNVCMAAKVLGAEINTCRSDVYSGTNFIVSIPKGESYG